jgi:hypothetical protein
LRESENKTELGKRLFNTEEAKVIGVDGGEFFRGILQSEGENGHLGAFDIFGEIGTRAFHLHPRLLFRNDSGWILQPVKNTVVNLLHDNLPYSIGKRMLSEKCSRSGKSARDGWVSSHPEMG